MPDTISHFVHGYFIYGLKGGIYSILPDILSFGRFFIGRLPKKYKYLMEGKYKKFFEKTKLESLDKTDKQLYKIFHSLIIWFAIYKLINGEKEFLCLFLAIIIDVFMHRREYFGTPFLYPISNYKFDGIHWYDNKSGWIISILITLIIYNFSHLFREFNPF